MEDVPSAFPTPEKLVPSFQAGRKQHEKPQTSGNSSPLPKHAQKAVVMEFDAIIKIQAASNRKIDSLLVGHFQGSQKLTLQKASVIFSIHEGLYSTLKFSFNIEKNERDKLGKVSTSIINSYEIVIDSRRKLDEAVVDIPPPELITSESVWATNIVREFLDKADKESNARELNYLLRNWIDRQLKLFTIVFPAGKVSLGSSLGEQPDVEEGSALKQFFRDVLGNADHKQENFFIFAVMQSDIRFNKATKIETYDRSFEKFLKEFNAARLNEALVDPSLAYWNKSGERRRLIRNGIKRPEDQPQLAWPNQKVYPFMKPFAHQMSVALANEVNLNKRLNEECLKHLCELRVVEFAKSEHGVFAGTLRLDAEFPARLGERDVMKIRFFPDIGCIWTAKPGLWITQDGVLTIDVQVKLSAPMEKYTDTDGGGKSYHYVNEARPPSVFTLTNDGGGEKLCNYLKIGPPNMVYVSIERSNKIEKAVNKAWSILNKYHKSKNDDKAIAKKFKNVLLGTNMPNQSIGVDFYGPRYNIGLETSGKQLAAFEAAVGKCENIIDWHYEEEQLEVFRNVGCAGQITLITGGAGTSKSETERGIVGHLVKAGLKIIVVAPQNKIADKVVVDIQALLNNLCPGTKAARWLPVAGQIKYLEHLSLGQPAFVDWRLGEGNDSGASEDLREIIASLRQIDERVNGVKDTRFQKVEQIPIRFFASEVGLLDLEPVKLQKRSAPIALGTLKERLKLEPIEDISQEDLPEFLKVSRTLLSKTDAQIQQSKDRFVPTNSEAVQEGASKPSVQNPETKTTGSKSRKKKRKARQPDKKDPSKTIPDVTAEASSSKQADSDVEQIEVKLAIAELNGLNEVMDDDPSIDTSRDLYIATEGIQRQDKFEPVRPREPFVISPEFLEQLKAQTSAMLDDYDIMSEKEQHKHVLHALCIRKRNGGLSPDQHKAMKLYAGEVLKDILAEDVQVVVATNFSLSDPILQTFKASAIIFTEAQQCDIPDGMLAMAHFPGANYVFSGDNKQEGLLTIDQYANLAGGILQTSLIDWQLAAKRKPLKLLQGYRQEPSMLTITSETIYHGELKPAPKMGPRPISDFVRSFNFLYLKLGKIVPIAMLNCEDTEEQKIGHTQSVCNPREADYAVHLALKLVQNTPIQPGQITFLSGYVAQVTLIQKAIDRLPKLHGAIVSTVHGYLSAENEVIIHSGVRTEGHGFTKNARHQAVVITRARSAYFLLSNTTKLELVRDRNESLETIKNALKKKGAVFQPEIDIYKALHDQAAPRIEARKAAEVKKWEDLKVAYEKAFKEGSSRPIFDKSLREVIDAERKENAAAATSETDTEQDVTANADAEQDGIAEQGEENTSQVAEDSPKLQQPDQDQTDANTESQWTAAVDSGVVFSAPVAQPEHDDEQW